MAKRAATKRASSGRRGGAKQRATAAPTLKNILGQPSWAVAGGQVQAFVTELGGHVGPVRFRLDGRVVEPYSVAPWATEKLDPRTNPPVIRVLRGDFFCMPFGGNTTPFGREKHPVHGETANAKWRFQSLQTTPEGRTCLHLSLRTRIRPGLVDKRISLIRGHRAIYSQHVIRQMSGPMTFGHHAMLRFPDEPGSGVISTSPFVYGQVFPEPIERPENRGYSILQPGAEFTSLESVPMVTGQTTDLSRYPARRGYEDLVMLVSDSSVPFAWTAVTFAKQGYVWFALKDPNVLPHTVLWISNGGRHYAPWNGRHINVMGLEEVLSYFHPGLAESVAENPISRKGYPTYVELNPNRPMVVNYIMAVARIPQGFDRVAQIQADQDEQSVTLTSASGQSVSAPIDVSFLRSAAAEAAA
ncbi:hypothetical protein [Fontivita pretiosa]|uniref:hypothetical protein n=1 Tax=Fontivita pretiosa TaxID=2989684 RepID=UPI003D17B288